MKAISSRAKSLTCLSAALLVSCTSLIAANNEWQTGSGNWFTGPWQLSAPPTSADQAIFSLNASSTAASIVVSIGDDAAAVASYLSIARGKTVELVLGTNASLTATGGTWQIGSGTGTGAASAPGKLKISGSTTGRASVAIGSGGINIGSSATQTGNSVEIAGNLDVQAAGGLVVGRFGNSNLLTIKDGAKLEGTSIWVSATQNITNGIGDNNGALISGSGTEVTLKPTSNLALVVAARPTTNLSTSQTGNYVRIEDGAAVRIDSVNSSSTADLKIGDTSFRVGNFVSVTGAGSVLELKGDTRIYVGVGSNNSNYNNSLSVGNGGAIKSDGAIAVAQARTSGAKNRLVIGSGGTLLVGGAITNSGGLVQLADGGVLRGETTAGSAVPVDLLIQGQVLVSGTVTTTSIGRFEAAGSGLASNVTTTVKNNGVFAVGLASATNASTLTLSSTVNLESGSVLEIGIFSDGGIDSINLALSGSLVLQSDAVFMLTLDGYIPKTGDSWAVFTGATSNIIGNFDMTLASLPTLSGELSWDYSRFNEAGGWQVAVIPEPRSTGLLLTAAIAGIGCFRRARRSSNIN